MKKVWIFGSIAFVIMLAVSFTVFSQKPVQYTPTAVVQLNADTIFNLVNAEREKAGVKPLVRDERLNQSAQLRIDDMIARNYYSHYDPVTGKSLVNIKPYAKECVNAGENLELVNLNNTDLNTAAINDWMGSESHRNAILNKKNDLAGIAVSSDKAVLHFCDL